MILSIIIPANNEEAYIGSCLEALLAQAPANLARGEVEIIVAGNACVDDTAEIARSYEGAFAGRGWSLVVLDDPVPGKHRALNSADTGARGACRGYLDADVICEPALIGQLIALLNRPEPTYAAGKLKIAKAKSWITHYYGDFYGRIPFVRGKAPGAGFFSVNAAGRARWDAFPDIISDDTFVRLQFTPDERVQAEAGYFWPIVEGFGRLVKVRRRQMRGDMEMREKYPELLKNIGHSPMSGRDHLRLFLEAPLSYIVYATVILAVKLGRPKSGGVWDRGR